jgi:hypothetical protein
MIVSEGGTVKWAKHSDGMRARGMGYIAFGKEIPGNTPTAKLWAKLDQVSTLDRFEGHSEGELWFDKSCGRVWEETMPLGYTGLVLTFLVPEHAY